MQAGVRARTLMPYRPVLQVRITAVHVECRACGETARIVRKGGAFERKHDPLTGWWYSHRDPKLIRVEMVNEGRENEWVSD